MFLLAIFFITLVIIIYYVYKTNKRPKDTDGIPSVSGLPYVWAILSKKSHDEVQDIIYKSSKGHEIFYFVRYIHILIHFLASLINYLFFQKLYFYRQSAKWIIWLLQAPNMLKIY